MASRLPKVPPGYLAIYWAEKVILLMLLHVHSPVACEPERPFDLAEAECVVENGFIDTFCGKVIRANISGDFASPKSYDEVAGPGAFKTCVDLTKQIMWAAHQDPSVLDGEGELLAERLCALGFAI
ncbi:hypothetical protein BO99DRAFT_432496 [Aspergillus violaceofuscus CBS 115571]|uniref:Uncharacterized protein n=1 Tax=Aspergillus violaceofuscus (strain CBS 115571) TaxID=1450538 RepID=A0A2V5H5W8_ASPV1|nr:hypothetical protein BO99DRAFT_432496 [Aspergillus violaceofuscus CBS 115571]